MTDFHDEFCPTPDGVTEDDLIHERSYIVRVYRKDDSTMVVRGAVVDRKPPGLYVIGDPQPLIGHHMIVDMTVALPTLEILDAKALIEVHPYPECPTIMDHYRNLIGMSVARGFTHKVREIFGGPRGCSHTTALLQAMGPAVVQATWSMRILAARDAGSDDSLSPPPMSAERRSAAVALNLNTCHIWAEDGEYIANARAGISPAVPVSVTRRLIELGRDPNKWHISDD